MSTTAVSTGTILDAFLKAALSPLSNLVKRFPSASLSNYETERLRFYSACSTVRNMKRSSLVSNEAADPRRWWTLAVLCLSLLVMFLVMAVQDAMAPRLQGLFTFAQTLLWVWMPLYLLLMQKRVYGQGWTMTVLKYCVLGICYFVLLSLGAAFTLLASLVWM